MRRGAGYNSEENRQHGPAVPNLPGTHVQAPMVPRPKGHTLKYLNGYPIAADADVVDAFNQSYKWAGRATDLGPVPPFALHEAGPPPAPREPPLHKREQQTDQGGACRQSRTPSWITYHGKVLRFAAFFREEVPNSPLESWRVRKVALRYYLENDQVEVVEQKELNSGLPQGILLKRHNAIQEGGAPLRWADLRVGGHVTLYRRTFHLTAADTFTRAFYSEQGQEQPPDLGLPEGPYDQRRKELEASRARASIPRLSMRLPRSPGRLPPVPQDVDPGELYISPRGPSALFELIGIRPPPELEARDNAILRFGAAWDNTAATFGEVLPFALAYHVSDGTIEVREVARRNNGRDPFPLLLGRCKLPKKRMPVLARPMSPATKKMLAIPYYDWRDLHLGATINVYGRPLLLYDCDEPTRTWLRHYVPGITEEKVTPIPVDFDPYGPKRPPLHIPPHTGIGSEEDSLQNVLRLVPRPPPRSYTDYLEKWNKVLRFEAVMAPLGPGRPLVGPHDAERRFILSFHLVDCTLSIFEPRRENSGMDGGTFLERNRVTNPATGRQYTETDMQVGAVLEVFGRGFALMEADGATLAYMESQSHEFPWADYDKVLSKLTAWLDLYPDQLPDRLRNDLLAADTSGTGYVNKHQLHALLSALGSDLSPHEVVTLVRQLGADRQGLLLGQLLGALGLAPPPEPEPTAALEPQEDLQPAPPPPQQPQVPFPAPGILAAATAAAASRAPQQQQPQNVWAPQIADPPVPPQRAAPVYGTGYRGIGPTPGHPAVQPDPAPTSQHHHHQPAPFGPSMRRSTSSYSSDSVGGDDRRSTRDTLDKTWRGPQPAAGISSGGGKEQRTPTFSAWSQPPSPGPVAAPQQGAAAGPRVGGSYFLTTGVKQPTTLWQTTNMAPGGVGHTASFQRR